MHLRNRIVESNHRSIKTIMARKYCSIFEAVYWLIGLVGSVFANGLGDWGSIPALVIPKTLKMVLDTSLFNTWHYKVHIKGKVKHSRGSSSAFSYTSV